jgi:transposase
VLCEATLEIVGVPDVDGLVPTSKQIDPETHSSPPVPHSVPRLPQRPDIGGLAGTVLSLLLGMSGETASKRQQRLFEVPQTAKEARDFSRDEGASGLVCLRPFRAWEPDQGMLLPQYVRDELGPDHLSCFFLGLSKTLDFSPILTRYTGDRGQPAYHPVMMTILLMYGYAVGVVSSRKISRMCRTDLAFRFISGGARPDHDTICAFRVRHLSAFRALFMQTIELARQMGFIRLGHISVDGSKFEANASKHKAMSYERMPAAMKKLEEEIDRLLKEAEAIDAEEDRRYGKGKRGDELPPGLTGPGELAKAMKQAKARMEAERKRELVEEKKRRLKQIGEAKAELEKEAEQKAKREGKDVKKAEPDPKAQRNFTDPESRIMPKNKRTFLQAFNAQLAVEAGTQLIVAEQVIQATNDANQLSPMVEQVISNTGAVPREVSADSGYFDEEDIKTVERLGAEAFVATQRQAHGAPPPPARGRTPSALNFKERMARKLRTIRGRTAYARRKVTVEPTIGQIKNRTTRRFSLRGLARVSGEFSLLCAVHNLVKLFTLTAGQLAAA